MPSFLSSSKDLYSLAELRTIVNEYVQSHSLVNPNEQQYIHPDELLLSILIPPKSNEKVDYVKREEAVKRLCGGMQDWHEVTMDGKEPVLRQVGLSL